MDALRTGQERWTEVWRVVGGTPVAMAVDSALWVVPDPSPDAADAQGTPALVLAVDPTRAPRPGSVLVLPIRPLDGLCAVLLPPDGQVACLDGRSLPQGPTVVSHGQELEVGGHVCWFSVGCDARVVRYDPAQHGQRRHCSISASELVVGEPVVTCPGTPFEDCEALTRRATFSSGSPCPCCGSDRERRSGAPPAALRHVCDLVRHNDQAQEAGRSRAQRV